MKTNLIEISKCEVCKSTDLAEVLNLGPHPMCDDLVAEGDPRVCKNYPIEILYCEICRTAHQKYQIPKAELFPKTYHYRSRFTADVLEGMKTLVNDSKKFVPDFSNKKVIDIGCNDGSLLDFFRREGAITVGIEPTDAFKDAAAKGHTVYQDFLTIDSAKRIVAEHGNFDIVTFTNVFAHIEDLDGVILSLKEIMKETSILIIENHYLGAVIERNQFDTFYHEHPRTYSYTSFEFIAKSLGLNLINVEFPSRYGGNIRVMIGDKANFPNGDQVSQEVIEKENCYGASFVEMNRFIDKWKIEKKAQIEELVAQHGPISAKAFPGRAAILIKLLSLDTHLIQKTFEKPGSMKIDHYLPGTRIPIVSDDEFVQEMNSHKVILNNAWHISSEIERYLRKLGYTGEIVNIL